MTVSFVTKFDEATMSSLAAIVRSVRSYYQPNDGAIIRTAQLFDLMQSVLYPDIMGVAQQCFQC
ncbi:hypothetical protein BIW11_04674 [Tropilaelaps mercedesae]|uniref:Uncharacterized protein n=1 Tax=Tropilaelaps mercedesae TaxID=418985 RepID=A0A1V9X3M5_9ACAR|nr:hypothetical protein BIW11_04674 [Tropilaelaps mercedesae]